MLRIALLTLLVLRAERGAAATDADALLKRLARPAPATTPFTEVRFSSLLATPIVLSGELQYAAADTLGKRVDQPYREQIDIHGEDVRVARDGERERHFSLKRAPELRGIVASFAALLAGDRAQLERYFQLGLEEHDDDWQLTLTPRDERVRQHLTAVTVIGRTDTPRCLVTAEADGDASVMLLGDAPAGTLPAPLEISALEKRCRSRP